MKAQIISYTLEKANTNQRGIIQRALNGYKDYSNKGFYKYERKGLIDKITCIKLNRGVIIISEKDKRAIVSVLKKNKASVKIIPVDIDSSFFN